MRILIDMNLTPQWVPFLSQRGYEVTHWSEIGPQDAPDTVIMAWALENEAIVFTNDLDFSAILASTRAPNPSVLQIRMQDLLPSAAGQIVLNLLSQFEKELAEGILISADVHQSRVRLLPLT